MTAARTEYEDNYPYEKLTRKHTAEIQRMRDQQMRKLRKEMQLLRNELYQAKRRLAAVEEAGIDPDVLIATKEAFKDVHVTHRRHTP